MTDRQRLWTPAFAGMLALILFGFANLAAFYGLEPWLRRRGLSAGEAGGAIAAFTLVALLLIPPLSARVTPARAGRCIVAGFAVTLLALPMYALADGFLQLVALRMLHGLGFVLTLVGIVSAFVAMVPESRAGEAYSLFGLADLLPFALVPPLMEATLPRFGGDPAAQYAGFALVQAVALALAVLLAWTIRPPATPPQAAAPKGGHGTAVLALLALNLCAFVAHAVLFSLAKPRAVELGGEALVGAFFGTQTGVMILLRLTTGGLFDTVDQRRVCALGLGAVVLGLCLMALPLAAWMLIAAAALFGLGFGAAVPLLNALMHHHSPPEQRGGNINLMMLMLQAGYLAGPLLAGFVVGFAGYAGGFVFAAACLALAMPALWLLRR